MSITKGPARLKIDFSIAKKGLNSNLMIKSNTVLATFILSKFPFLLAAEPAVISPTRKVPWDFDDVWPIGSKYGKVTNKVIWCPKLTNIEPSDLKVTYSDLY